MDKSEIAILISIVSAVFTGGNFLLSYKRTLNDNKRLKRKDLVFETGVNPIRNQEKWAYLHITIRNLEPVAGRIKSVSVRKGRAKIINYEAGTVEDGGGGRLIMNELPEDELAKKVVLNFGIAPIGTSEFGDRIADIRFLDLLAYGWTSTCKLSFDWEWSDK